MNNLDTAKIIEMIEDGFAVKRVAIILNYKEADVKDFVEKNNLSIKKEVFTEAAIPRIKKLYGAGVSAKNLGIKYSIDKRRVQKWAKEDNALRDASTAGRFIEFDQKVFDTIDTEEKYYWFGFMLADCYNYNNERISISLQSRDLEHMKQFARFMKMSEDRVWVAKNKEGKEYCGLIMNSTYLATQFDKLGCPQAKSFIVKYPNWVEADFHRHFIRGFFDGNGSIKMNKKTKEWRICICSTKELNDKIKEIVEKTLEINVYVNYHSKTGNNTYTSNISGNEQVFKFCRWLYEPHTVRLERKYNRYILLLNQQKNRTFFKKTNRENYLLTPKQKNQIVEDISNGEDFSTIAEKFKIEESTVETIYEKIIIDDQDLDNDEGEE
jgi:hypothetical protein